MVVVKRVMSTMKRSPATKMPNNSVRVRVALIQHLFVAAREYGLPCQVMLAGSGLKPGQLQDPQAELPIFHVERMLQTGLAVSHDPLLGLKLAQYANLDAFGVLGSLLRVCRTIQDAVDKLLHYGPLLGIFGKVWSWHKPGQLLIGFEFNTDTGQDQRHITEYMMLALARCLSAQRVDQSETLLHGIYFKHGLPSGVTANDYRALLGDSGLHFNQPVSAISISTCMLSGALLHGDTTLREAIQQLADDLLTQSADFSFMTQAANKLRVLIHEADPSRERLAEAMGLGVRQMNRYLKLYGYSYRVLLDQARREEALQLLQTSDLKIEEIAQRLCYQSSQSFIRWFKRSVGVTPQSYRERGQFS